MLPVEPPAAIHAFCCSQQVQGLGHLGRQRLWSQVYTGPPLPFPQAPSYLVLQATAAPLRRHRHQQLHEWQPCIPCVSPADGQQGLQAQQQLLPIGTLGAGVGSVTRR